MAPIVPVDKPLQKIKIDQEKSKVKRESDDEGESEDESAEEDEIKKEGMDF